MVEFDFSITRLSSRSRQQLNNILRAIKPGSKATQDRSKLLQLIESDAYDLDRGIHLQITPYREQKRRLPTYSKTLSATEFPSKPFPHCFFGNSLTIPADYESGSFNDDTASMPKDRATNIGWLVVTIEYDCQTTEQFEETLAWTRGGDGEFNKSPFAQVHRELCRFKDYRGYCIVFSGNRSLHFHLIFSTKHLELAPWDCTADTRFNQPQSLLISQAHARYWDEVSSLFDSILHPPVPPDRSLRTFSQLRRSPWALRELESDSEVLGLSEGTIVPQLVIHENIRTRVPKSAERFMVSPDFRAIQSTPRKSHGIAQFAKGVSDEELLHRGREWLLDEWGTGWPLFASIQKVGDDALLNFRNHEHDDKPSTFVKGSYRKLEILGDNTLGREFYLPCGLTANEFYEELCKAKSSIAVTSASLLRRTLPRTTAELFCIEYLEPNFSKPIPEGTEPIPIYRNRLRKVIDETRRFSGHMLVRSPEGAGKTSALFHKVAVEALNAAPQRNGFVCFAFRSKAQAEEKASEYRLSGPFRNAVTITSFWEHYKQSCMEAGQPDIPQDSFKCRSLDAILKQIASLQPQVFQILEGRRRSLWTGADGRSLFDSPFTVLFTSHAQAKTWYRNQTTRPWYHPDFVPFSGDDQRAVKGDLRISKIVIDEPEVDEVLHLIDEPTRDLIARIQRKHPSWRNMSRTERLRIFEAHKAEIKKPSDREFEKFDEWLRFDLDEFECLAVDSQFASYGWDRNGNGLYSATHGDRYYLGVQSWLSDCKADLTFLTTECLVSNVLIRAFENEGMSLKTLDLEARCTSFPVRVPINVDDRAAADRKDNDKITALALELLADPKAIVIGNGIELDHPRCMNFQEAKGRNGLEHYDTHIIATCLEPNHYARLNVIGQWLDMPDVVDRHYEDNINQAVGRSQGFRQTGESSARILCGRRRPRFLKPCFQHETARVTLIQ